MLGSLWFSIRSWAEAQRCAEPAKAQGASVRAEVERPAQSVLVSRNRNMGMER